MIERRYLIASIIGAAVLILWERQILANTLIVVLRDDEVAFVGADSEVSTPQGGPARTACKIRITDKHVWATAGMIQEVGGPFNVWIEAQAAIKLGGTMDEIMSRFEGAVARQLREYLPRFRTAYPGEYAQLLRRSAGVINSVFFEGTNLYTRDFVVPEANAPQNIEIVRHSCPGNCPVSGQVQLVIGDHDAADAELARLPQFWFSKGIIDGMNYLVEMQHRATPWSVAAPVSILRIDKSGAFQWVQKGICS